MLRDVPILEFCARSFPLFPRRFFVAEKCSQHISDLLDSGQAAVEDALAALVKNGAVRRLKQNVSSGIAESYLRFNFLIKVVRSVLRLPKAVPEIEFIEKCAIYSKRPTLRSSKPTISSNVCRLLR